MIRHVAGRRTRTIGEAVDAGKAAPGDLAAFIQQAVDDGTVTAYARRAHGLGESRALGTLPQEQIRTIVQGWVNEYKVGVDCSGLALYMLIQARREEINLAEDARREGADVQVPEPPEQGERNAAHFQSNEPTIGDPGDLRPGHFWVMADGNHIRVIGDVGSVEEVGGERVIQFETVESEGTDAVVERTWTIPLAEVDSLDDRSETANIEGPDVAGGTFHQPEDVGSHPGNTQ